jgi:hypothetical protein
LFSEGLKKWGSTGTSDNSRSDRTQVIKFPNTISVTYCIKSMFLTNCDYLSGKLLF